MLTESKYSRTALAVVDGLAFRVGALLSGLKCPSGRLRALGLACLALPLSAHAGAAQELLRVHDGRFADRLWGVRSVGDHDNDGVVDYIVFGQTGYFVNGVRTLFSGASGEIIWGPIRVPGDDLAARMLLCGDFDGDDLPDVVVNYRPFSATGPHVEVISSGTGAEIFRIDRPELPEFAYSGEGAGDVNGDGIPDLLVTSAIDRVSVYAGPSGTLLYDRFGAATYPEAEPIGDVDGDGCDDFAAGWYLSDRVAIFSGASGSVITYLLGNAWSGGQQSFLGRGLAKAGDLNGDGVPDLFVGGPESECDPCGNAKGFVRAYDGATWEVLWETEGGNGNPFNPSGSTFSEFGWQMEGGGDINGDGVNDLFALHNGGSEHAEFLSGATGATLYRLRKWNLPGFLEFPADLGDCDIIGDLDGDGYDEFAVIDRSESFYGGQLAGRVYILRGSPGDIIPVCSGSPASNGVTPDLYVFGPITEGAREMELRLRDGLSGETLLLLTGLTGPGIPLGSGTLCLNPAATARLGQPLTIDSAGLAATSVRWLERPVAATWAAGTTWTVQGVYSDSGDPLGFNTTSALEITFTR